MIYDGALSASAIAPVGHWVWCLVIGALIILWICVGIRSLGKLNTAAMGSSRRRSFPGSLSVLFISFL